MDKTEDRYNEEIIDRSDDIFSEEIKDKKEDKYIEDKNTRNLSQGIMSLIYILFAFFNFYFDRSNLGYFYAVSSFFWFYRGTEEMYDYYHHKTAKKALFILFSYLAGLAFLFKFYLFIH